MMLIVGALLGFIAVAFGAYAEHGLREVITLEQFRHVQTAIRYNELYAVVVSVMGLTALNGGRLAQSIIFRISGCLFVVGAMLFSFSIYLSAVFALPGVLSLTPKGGVMIMFAWLVLLVAGVLEVRKRC